MTNVSKFFSHKMSPLCKFGATRANKLCQFRHTNKQTESCDKSKNISTRKEDKRKHNVVYTNREGDTAIKLDEDETKDDDKVYPCDLCNHVFNKIEDLIDLYGETAHNI